MGVLYHHKGAATPPSWWAPHLSSDVFWTTYPIGPLAPIKYTHCNEYI